jgi:hypothetical protein
MRPTRSIQVGEILGRPSAGAAEQLIAIAARNTAATIAPVDRCLWFRLTPRSDD